MHGTPLPLKICLPFLFLLLGLLILPSVLFATEPLTAPVDSLWGRPEGSLLPTDVRRLREGIQFPSRDLREILGQFQQTCSFLDSMQEHDPESGSFGGLHEGEGNQLWNIIETDNTQEAIRVWCEYADYFEDTERFRDNVESAWTYCDNYPAWEESEANNFYAMHNAGWGLVATIGYLRVYGQGRDEYGHRCAEHLIENVPEITPEMEDNLMPLVAGWSAGTLYEFGLTMNNRDYQLEAIGIAIEVKEWIESRPDRLNRNEIWALCGGTAMWGVIRTLVREDTTAARWIPELLENMDVLAGGGNWNNSWNIWYAHAWLAAFEFSENEDYLRNAETIIDSLLVQDTDDDGGIPATMRDPNDRDQAWVSAYTAWMGLRNLFEGIPDVDVALLDVIAPSNNRPWPVGGEIEFIIKAQQNGAIELLENVPILINGNWEDEQSFELLGWEPRNIRLERLWRPPAAGHQVITFIAQHEDDADHSNDTIQHRFDVRATRLVTILLQDNYGNPIGGEMNILSEEFPVDLPPFYVGISERRVSTQCALMDGIYSIRLEPNFPYAEQVLEHQVISGDGDQVIIFTLIPPPLLVLDADTDSTNFGFLARSLDEIEVPFRRWRFETEGDLANRSAGFQSLIYFTGDRTEELITEENRSEIGNALTSGISVLVSGQNIAADLAGTAFLEETLHAQFLTDNTRSRQVAGVNGDELLGGMRLLLLGNQGAGNQTSTDGITATGNAVNCGLYTDRGDTAGMVRWVEESGARGIFCSFGIEAVSGSGGTTNRAEFLQRALGWMGLQLAVEEDNRELLPASPLLVSGYPNPFNNSINLILNRFNQSEAINLTIFDVKGRRICSIAGKSGGRFIWGGITSDGTPVSAGNYFVAVENSQALTGIPQMLRITLQK